MIPAFVGAGIAVGGAVAPAATGHTAGTGTEHPTLLPAAKPKPRYIQLAACKPCNPCAAKKRGCNPCNPCAAKGGCNPCNPCGAGGGVSTKCFVPRLQAAWAKSPCNPCNPCAPKKGCNPCAPKKACNPCNPCAAKKRGCSPCNPCAAKKACNPCNPCAAKKRGCNPCNPCAAKNPCNPCAAGAGAEISSAEAKAVYDCLKPDMVAAYAKAGVAQVKGYSGWLKVNAVAYQSATHGARYVNNYADKRADHHYNKFEKAGIMPKGSVLAKDSFAVNPDGKVSVGPLFVMEKMNAGFNEPSGDWRYSMIMPNGKVAGMTKGKGLNMKFCAECHAGVAPELDHIMLVPNEYRAKF